MSLPHGKNTRLPDTYISTTTVRQALHDTYPAYTTLADIALGSTILRKHLTIPKVLDSGVASCVRPCPQGNRILLPVRQVGMFRSPRSTWAQPTHHLLPSRRHVRLVPVSVTLPQAVSWAANRAGPSRVLSLPAFACGAVGYEPRSLKQARAHPSWPLWEAAVNKELDGLRRREAYEKVNEADLPREISILPTKMLFKDKHSTGAKCRLVVRGDLENPKPPSSSTYASTPTATEVRTLI
jgi:hypothetical protein